jgi:predicted RNA-binding protein YlqC (UPF0109 family)
MACKPIYEFKENGVHLVIVEDEDMVKVIGKSGVVPG